MNLVSQPFKSAERLFHVVLFIMLYQTVEMKAIELYFSCHVFYCVVGDCNVLVCG